MQPAQGYEMHKVSSTEADPRSKALYDLWSKVAEAERAFRAAVKVREDADKRAKFAESDETAAHNRLRDAKEQLDKELAIPWRAKAE